MNAQQVQVLLHTFPREYFKISSPVVVETKKISSQDGLFQWSVLFSGMH